MGTRGKSQGPATVVNAQASRLTVTLGELYERFYNHMKARGYNMSSADIMKHGIVRALAEGNAADQLHLADDDPVWFTSVDLETCVERLRAVLGEPTANWVRELYAFVSMLLYERMRLQADQENSAPDDGNAIV